MASIFWSLPGWSPIDQIQYDWWGLSLVTPPQSEPVSIPEAKFQCNIEPDDHYWDALLNDLIVAARGYCERRTNRAFITQQWDLWLQSWPVGRIRIPRGRLQSVDAFQFTDSTETQTAVDPSVYVVNSGAEPAEIVLRFAQIWPPVILSPSRPINVRFTCGWQDSASVPMEIRQAIKMLVSYWFNNRDSGEVGVRAQAIRIPDSVDDLLANHRLDPIGFSQIRALDQSRITI